MYKRKIRNIIYFIVLFAVLFLPVSLAQNDVETQRMTDMIQKIMQTSSKDIAEDINRNMDENFKVLDQRVNGNMSNMLRKMIIALAGVMIIVAFTFVYVINRVQKKYDLVFYEKMIDSKVDKLQSRSLIISDGEEFYSSVVKSNFDRRYLSPQ